MIGTAAVAVAAAIVVAVVVPSGGSGDFRALGAQAVRVSSTGRSTAGEPPTTAAPTTTAPTTTPPTTATPSTADPARCTGGPHCVGGWNLDTCEGYLGAVLSAGRPPSSGEVQHLWLECGIDLTAEPAGQGSR
ncbi:MAG TPA: hypothetical protein VFW63_08425 [Acidimicrobiales bacterium]|nr:hypothetical protein [Acidimicrobiales bacterium]